MVDHNERGVALGTMVDVLGCDVAAVTDQERSDVSGTRLCDGVNGWIRRERLG